jgi:hypothetical protein
MAKQTFFAMVRSWMRRAIEKEQAYQCTDPNAALLSLSHACAEIQQG